MEKTIRLFTEWKVEQPTQRRAMYVHSSHQFNHENVLYLICCWDYVYKPTDAKVQGLIDVFITANAPGEINVSGSNRKKALKLLGNPAAPKVSYEGTNKRAPITLLHKGGVKTGGAANYNLMTQAIEVTLPECMRQVDDFNWGDKMLSKLVKKGVGNLTPTPAAVQVVKHISQYWGAAVVELGLT